MCSFVHCKITRRKNIDPPVRFHSFPKNRERAVQWAINCGRPDLIEKTKIYPNSLHICSLHFERPCFNNDLKKSLTKFAIPTIFHVENNYTIANEQQSNGASTSISLPENTYLSQTSVDIGQAEESQKLFDLNIPVDEDFHQAYPEEEQIQEVLYADENETFYISTEFPITVLLRHASNQTDPLQDEAPILVDASRQGSHKICRLCAVLEPSTEMIYIFGKKGTTKEICQKINRLLPPLLQVEENDFLPQWICIKCSERLESCDQTVKDFVAANKRFKHILPTAMKPKHKKSTTKASSLLIGNLDCCQTEQFESATEDPTSIDEESDPEQNTTSVMHQQANTNNSSARQISLVDTDTDVLADSSNFKCSQCKNVFSNKASLFYHEITKHSLAVVTNTNNMEYDGQDIIDPEIMNEPRASSSSAQVSVSVEPESICSPLKRKAENYNIQLRYSSSSNSLRDLEDGVRHTETSSILVTNKADDNSLKRQFQPKTLKQTSEQEYPEKIIQNSHMSIPTSLDSKTFLCHVCNRLFDSIESLLTHRFIEHTKQEISRGRIKIKKKTLIGRKGPTGNQD